MHKTKKQNAIAFVKVFLLILLASHCVYAQRRGRFSIKEGSSGIKPKVESIRAPEFKDSKQGISGCGYWGAITVEFELQNRKDDWIDELEVYCLLLVERRNGGPLALEDSFRYMNVRGGEKNRVVVYINPTFFRRYQNVNRPDMNRVSAYIELRVDGTPIHRAPILNTASGIPKDWYQQASQVKRIPNALQAKSKTPFATLDMDYYLYEVPASQ